jgi:hypothetical protein
MTQVHGLAQRPSAFHKTYRFPDPGMPDPFKASIIALRSMFPVLPALILLLIQGHIGLEQSAFGAPSAAFLHALNREARTQEELASVEEDLAVLLSLSKDPQYARVVLEILQMAFAKPDSPKTLVLSEEPEQRLLPVPKDVGKTRDAYSSCRRTRDGP